MPGICEGTWTSKINNVDDGTIEVEQDGLGFIGGKHNNSRKGIFGICRSKANPPHITFSRFDRGTWFIYEGDIERRTTPRPRFVIVNGSVTKVFGAKKKKAPLADDWSAEKPT